VGVVRDLGAGVEEGCTAATEMRLIPFLSPSFALLASPPLTIPPQPIFPVRAYVARQNLWCAASVLHGSNAAPSSPDPNRFRSLSCSQPQPVLCVGFSQRKYWVWVQHTAHSAANLPCFDDSEGADYQFTRDVTRDDQVWGHTHATLSYLLTPLHRLHANTHNHRSRLPCALKPTPLVGIP
jgi:hypothetical protein